MDTARAAVVLAAWQLLPARDEDLSVALSELKDVNGLLHPPSTASLRTRGLLNYLRSAGLERSVQGWRGQLESLPPEVSWVSVLDDDYPRRLLTTRTRPPYLFYVGDVSIAQGRTAAVIGSRNADGRDLAATRHIASALTSIGVCVVSGLARGVDAAAHHAALSAGGRTLAVLPTGIRTTFPADHAALADAIGRDGLVVSQFPPGAPETWTSFLERNAVISGISEISIVTRARENSGSANEVGFAIEQGRPVIFWEPTMGGSDWARRLVDRGEATFAQSEGDILQRFDGARSN